MALREPAHTGENRCWPCTVVNSVLVAALALWLFVRRRRVAGLAVSAVGIGLVYLRGYVVPYTPVFAPRLVEASPLPGRLFHDGQFEPRRDERESLAETDLDGETVLQELGQAGVVESDGEMLHLAAEFESAWHEEMDRLVDRSMDALASEAERSVSSVSEADTLESDGDRWVVVGGTDAFLSRPVAVAELAAYQVLGSYLDDDAVRLAGARSLRMFLETCPVCGATIVESTEANCCGAYADPGVAPSDILVCPDCEHRLFTFPSE